jgi:hypothetical protein
MRIYRMKKQLKMQILLDNTGSMGQAALAIRMSLNPIIAMLALVLGNNVDNDKLKLSVCGDYDPYTPDFEKGGYNTCNSLSPNIQAFLNKYVKAMGGGGDPEAYRTALVVIVIQLQYLNF